MNTNGIIDFATDRTYATPENARKALDRVAKKHSIKINDMYIWREGVSCVERWQVSWLIAAKDNRFVPVVIWNRSRGENLQPLWFARQGIAVVG